MPPGPPPAAAIRSRMACMRSARTRVSAYSSTYATDALKEALRATAARRQHPVAHRLHPHLSLSLSLSLSIGMQWRMACIRSVTSRVTYRAGIQRHMAHVVLEEAVGRRALAGLARAVAGVAKAVRH